MYEKPLVTTHNFLMLVVSAATTGVHAIARMPGKRYCRILDIQATVTTAVVSTSANLLLQIGDGTDVDKFVDDQILCVDTAAVGAVRSIRTADARVAAYATSGKGFIDWDTDGVAGTEASPVALSSLVYTPINGTGGSVAGAVNVTTVIEWW